MQRGTRKKFAIVLVLAVAAGCAYVNVTFAEGFINWIILGIMGALIVFAHMFGVSHVRNMETDLIRINRQLDGINPDNGQMINRDQLRQLSFQEKHLIEKYKHFLKAQEDYAATEIEEFINSDDISTFTERGVWELFADVLTGLGILGTFIGLIIGLRSFDLNDLSQFSASVVPLLEGIKVAFLTSIYGLALSFSYSYGLLAFYGSMEETVDEFLEKFHLLWGKELRLDEQALKEQAEQTELLRELTETFKEELARSFTEVITPAIDRMNEQFANYSKEQQVMLKEAAAQFAQEFKNAFIQGFAQFEKNLEKTNEMQSQYMKFLQQTMDNLSNSIEGQIQSIDGHIAKSDQLHYRNMQDVTSLIKQVQEDLNVVSQTSRQYSDAVAQSAQALQQTENNTNKLIEQKLDRICMLLENDEHSSGKSAHVTPVKADDKAMKDISKQLQLLVEIELESLAERERRKGIKGIFYRIKSLFR